VKVKVKVTEWGATQNYDNKANIKKRFIFIPTTNSTVY